MAAERKQFILEGLCCENCAAGIQKDIQALEGVKSADVNVDTTILSVEYEGNIERILKAVTGIAVSHDEDIVVKEA